MRAGTIAILAVVAFNLPLALAHEGHVHHLMGVVTAADASHLQVEAKDGTTVSVAVDKETKYLRGKNAVTNADVKVGDRIVVELTEKDGKQVAREVQLGTSRVADHTHH